MVKYTTAKGLVVESDMTDSEAITKLRELADGKLAYNRFANDMVTKHEIYRGQLSESQWAWVHKLVQDAEAKTAADTLHLPKPDKLFEIFDVSAEHLKWPKLRFNLTADDGDDVVLVVRVGGEKSKFADQVMFTSGNFNAGTNKFYGALDRDGNLTVGRAMDKQVRAIVDDLARDPVRTAVLAGQSTGNCCFCNMPLTDPRSLKQGYGPICAKHWKLAWGEQPAAEPKIDGLDEVTEVCDV